MKITTAWSNIKVTDNVMLIKPFDKLTAVGSVFTVSAINQGEFELCMEGVTDTFCIVNIVTLCTYFEKLEENKWTDWSTLMSRDGKNTVVAYYKTNNRKVIVKLHNGVKAMATCNTKYGDSFNLATGIQLAYMRCISKTLQRGIENYSNVIEEIKRELKENDDKINQLINTMEIKLKL